MQFGIKEVLNLTILDFATKEPVTYIDYATASTNEITAERTSIRGGWGMAKLLEFDGQKEAELQLNIPLVDLNLLGHIAGEKVINNSTANILKTERVRVKEGEGGFKISITDEPVNEPSVYIIEGLRDFGESVDVEWDGKEGLIDSDSIEANQELYVLYMHKAPEGTKEVQVRTDVFPREVEMHGIGLARKQKDGQDYPVHVLVHKARPRADFTFTMEGEEPTSLELIFDVAQVRDEDGNGVYISYLFEDTPYGDL